MFEKKELEKIFSEFAGLKILVVGDVMIDSYLWGKVDRISPEAPVPVVSLMRRENRLGGAANVALNLQALGAVPILCSVIGSDARSEQFIHLLEEKDLIKAGILNSKQRLTTTKFRIIGNNSHLLRVDEETDSLISNEESDVLFNIISKKIENGVRAIVFEDYDKGVITPALIRKTVELANSKKIPVAVDPKKRNFNEYSHLTLFKPNLKELRDGLKLDVLNPSRQELDHTIIPFMKEKQFKITMVTLSEAGVYICFQDESKEFSSTLIPAHFRNIADVSGAGDTVISIAALGLACGLKPPKIAALANLAGGLVCEEVGVVQVKMAKLYHEALLNLVNNG